MSGAGERIRAELMTWPGVSAEPHRFGGTEYRFGRKEMGHVHGDNLAQPHHVMPDTGRKSPASPSS